MQYMEQINMTSYAILEIKNWEVNMHSLTPIPKTKTNISNLFGDGSFERKEIYLPSSEARTRFLKRAGYNLFNLNAENVFIDFLTDSGCGAMSKEQIEARKNADESYAGSKSFDRFESAVREFTNLPYVLPAHQGRAAEHVFDLAFITPEKNKVVGNAFFDTTRAHIIDKGGTPIDLTVSDEEGSYPFCGNINLARLAEYMQYNSRAIAYILLTVTCNQAGGRPVSLANIRATSLLAKKYQVPLYLDAARINENAFFIKKYECHQQSINQIIHEMTACADGVLASAKKCAIAPSGGFIATRHKKVYNAIAPYTILYDGYLTYGGMSGATMEIVAHGLRECVSEEYLSIKFQQIQYLYEHLGKIGYDVLRPHGGHAVFIDAGAALPRIPWHQFPAQALAIEAYREGGIRTCAVDSILEGRENGRIKRAKKELLRLAIPSRVYHREHMDYVINIFSNIWDKRHDLRGIGFEYESPRLSHFRSRFTLL